MILNVKLFADDISIFSIANNINASTEEIGISMENDDQPRYYQINSRSYVFSESSEAFLSPTLL